MYLLCFAGGFDKFMVIGFSVASAVVGAVAIIMLVMTVVACYKCTSYFKHKSGKLSYSVLLRIII